jgi:hypothetical protein
VEKINKDNVNRIKRPEKPKRIQISPRMKERIYKHKNQTKRRKDMRQKYVISLNDIKNKLKIREYAILDKNLNKVPSSMLQKGNFSFLCEESYESKIIKSSISKGMNALVAILRTDNIFPIEPYATKIAGSVMELYNSTEYDSVELFFDDVDLVSV